MDASIRGAHIAPGPFRQQSAPPRLHRPKLCHEYNTSESSRQKLRLLPVLVTFPCRHDGSWDWDPRGVGAKHSAAAECFALLIQGRAMTGIGRMVRLCPPCPSPIPPEEGKALPATGPRAKHRLQAMLRPYPSCTHSICHMAPSTLPESRRAPYWHPLWTQ